MKEKHVIEAKQTSFWQKRKSTRIGGDFQKWTRQTAFHICVCVCVCLCDAFINIHCILITSVN
jgi:hypothetical protein